MVMGWLAATFWKRMGRVSFLRSGIERLRRRDQPVRAPWRRGRETPDTGAGRGGSRRRRMTDLLGHPAGDVGGGRAGEGRALVVGLGDDLGQEGGARGGAIGTALDSRPE